MKILSLTPNVQYLKFVTVIAEKINFSCPQFLLHNLKSLTILCCNSGIQTVANKIAFGTLDSFSFASDSYPSLGLFLNYQKNITNLSLHNLNDNDWMVPARYLKEHKLNQLSLITGGYVGKIRTLKNIIIQQAPYLKNLDLSGSFVDNATFKQITALYQLESLAVIINGIDRGIDQTSMFTFQRLQQLKELTIIMNSNVEEDQHMNCFSQTRLRKLTKLEIKFPMIKICPKSFARLGSNMQGLKHLYIDCDLHFDAIAAISSNFHVLETLILRDVKELALKEIFEFNYLPCY